MTGATIGPELFANGARDTLNGLIIHEFAHYFDFTHTLSDKISLAAFRLYVHNLGFYDDKRERCETRELLADL